MIGILSFFVLIACLVTVHEFGHYIVARFFGVKVPEFAIGFGKTIFSKKFNNGTIFMIKSIPLGGYVKMLGDENVSSFQQSEKSDDFENINSKTPFQKLLIALAGPVFNFLFAIFLFFTIFQFNGRKIITPVVNDIIESSILKEKIKIGDKIISINNKNIETAMDVKKILFFNKDDNFDIKILTKENKINVFKINISNSKNERLLGVVFGNIEIQKLSLLNSIKYSFIETYDNIYLNIQGIIKLFSFKGDIKNSLGGPLKIAELSKDASKGGFFSFLYFMSIISITLGVFNLIPIPLVDGGHILFNAIEIVIRRKIPNIIYKISYYLGILIVGSLISFSLLNDINNVIIKKFF